MARRLRLEYADGLYHVINRGNYRRDVFESAGAVGSFEEALAEAVLRHGWALQAYVVMSNHYHLIVKTPEPNLSQGMHWLQSTVATRFNRYRSERGHMFQGRFQALPIEDHRVMGHVIDYVHLNPVRAKIVTPGEVGLYPWSSLNRFLQRGRFPGLDPKGALEGRGWRDNEAGWTGYVQYLVELAGNLEEQARLGYDGFSSGWAIGSNDWRRALAKEWASTEIVSGLAASEAAALREVRWRTSLDDVLRRYGRTQEEAKASRKTLEWKLRVALAVREESGAAVSWLARELNLGTDASVRSLLSKLRHERTQRYSA